MNHTPAEPNSARHATGFAVVVAGLTLACFWPAIGADFVQWDDDVNIYENPHIRSLTGENLRWMLTDLEQAIRYKPLTWLAWAGIHAVAGLKPAAFHLANVLLHAANAAVLFLLLRGLLRVAAPEESAVRTSCCAVGGALFWSLHPLRVEPVAWATGLPYELSLLFALGMMTSYWRFAAEPEGPAARRRLGTAIGCFLLAVLTYPICLGLAVTPLVMDWWLARRRGAPGAWIQPRHLPFLLASGTLVLIALLARFEHNKTYSPAATLGHFSLVQRVMQACYIWASFAGRNVWTAGLSPLYEDLAQVDPLGWPFVASAVVVLGVSSALALRRGRWPGAWALWVCHLAWLVPVLGLTEHPHYPSDRYTYASGMVAGLVFAAALQQLGGRGLGRLAATSAGAVLVILAAQSAALVPVWRNTPRHHLHMIATVHAEALRSHIWVRLGLWFQRRRAFAEAETAYRNALPSTSDRPGLHHRIASMASEQGRLHEALPHYAAALQAGRVRDDLNGDYGLALLAVGQVEAAEQQFAEAVRLAPAQPRHRHNWALTLKRLGREAEAATQETEARRLTGPGQPPSVPAPGPRP